MKFILNLLILYILVGTVLNPIANFFGFVSGTWSYILFSIPVGIILVDIFAGMLRYVYGNTITLKIGKEDKL